MFEKIKSLFSRKVEPVLPAVDPKDEEIAALKGELTALKDYTSQLEPLAEKVSSTEKRLAHTSEALAAKLKEADLLLKEKLRAEAAARELEGRLSSLVKDHVTRLEAEEKALREEAQKSDSQPLRVKLHAKADQVLKIRELLAASSQSK